jgi:hypothetical protein
MKRIALLAALLSACTATVHPYSSSQPQYATAQTTTTQTSSDGTMVTSTSTTESASFQAYEQAQPASYEAQPAAEPAPPPPPAAAPAGLCHKKDTPDMCLAIQTMFEIGAIIKQHENGSCRDASRALNKYADGHADELDTFKNLEDNHTDKQMQGFQKRHLNDATPIMMAAMALDQHCEGDQKLDRALQRVGFTGMIGNPAM